jgi:hypothetical protein
MIGLGAGLVAKTLLLKLIAKMEEDHLNDKWVRQLYGRQSLDDVKN